MAPSGVGKASLLTCGPHPDRFNLRTVGNTSSPVLILSLLKNMFSWELSLGMGAHDWLFQSVFRKMVGSLGFLKDLDIRECPHNCHSLHLGTLSQGPRGVRRMASWSDLLTETDLSLSVLGDELQVTPLRKGGAQGQREVCSRRQEAKLAWMSSGRLGESTQGGRFWFTWQRASCRFFCGVYIFS